MFILQAEKKWFSNKRSGHTWKVASENGSHCSV